MIKKLYGYTNDYKKVLKYLENIFSFLFGLFIYNSFLFYNNSTPKFIFMHIILGLIGYYIVIQLIKVESIIKNQSEDNN